MARDQQLMTDDQIAELRDEMHAPREDICAALAEDRGGNPEDYRADRPVADGGE